MVSMHPLSYGCTCKVAKYTTGPLPHDCSVVDLKKNEGKDFSSILSTSASQHYSSQYRKKLQPVILIIFHHR